jgi:hypothetical protein
MLMRSWLGSAVFVSSSTESPGVPPDSKSLSHPPETNLELRSPEVAEYFPYEQSINTALRTLIQVVKGPRRRLR